MKELKSLSFAVIILLYASSTLKAQDQLSLEDKINRTIQRSEQGWQRIGVIDNSNRMPITPNEIKLMVALWERRRDGVRRESVAIRIYQEESSAQAAKWLRQYSDDELASAWQIEKYKAGDEAYLLKYRKGGMNYIYFRNNNIVGEIGGESLNSVERFAKYVLLQLPAI